MSIPQVRTYFWDKCQGFSVWYSQLATADGARFRAECAAAGKELCTWTVNSREAMLECARWGVYSIITDKPELWRDLRREIVADSVRALTPSYASYIFPYLRYDQWWFERNRKTNEETVYLEREGGKFDSVVVPEFVSVARFL
jgi:phosphatidylglycerol phospholipase C